MGQLLQNHLGPISIENQPCNQSEWSTQKDTKNQNGNSEFCKIKVAIRRKTITFMQFPNFLKHLSKKF